jgi:hypothetical protein
MQHARLEYAHLEGATLAGARLESAYLRGAHLEGVTRINWLAAPFGPVLNAPVYFNGARLSEAYLEGAVLGGAHLEDAELDFTHLERAALHGAHLQGADLGRACLAGADLRNAHLEGASLRQARLGGKEVDTATVERVGKWTQGFPEVLPPVNLREAFFDTETTLENVNLGDPERDCPQLADVHWGDVNVAVVAWNPAVNNLGDERGARNLEARHIEGTGAAVVVDYEAAVRANRQLSLVLREQGMNDIADAFAYRAQVLQRRVYELHEVYGLQGRLGRVILSYFLWGLAGYGYRPLRTLCWYGGVILTCAVFYYVFGGTMTLREAIVGSVTAFHGRGLFDTPLTAGQSIVAAVEAFFGLVIEVALIATFTWRFVGR